MMGSRSWMVGNGLTLLGYLLFGCGLLIQIYNFAYSIETFDGLDLVRYIFPTIAITYLLYLGLRFSMASNVQHEDNLKGLGVLGMMTFTSAASYLAIQRSYGIENLFMWVGIFFTAISVVILRDIQLSLKNGSA